MLARLRMTAREAARRAAFGTAAAVLLLAGAGFLTAAAWIGLAAALGALKASLLVGLTLVAAGCILAALAFARAAPPPPPEPGEPDEALRDLLTGAGMRVPPKGEAPPLVEAFIFGLVTALRLRR